MLFVEIGTQRRKIGRIEVLNKGKDPKRAGLYKYAVMYKRNGVKIQFEMSHIRVDGVMKLLAKITQRVQREVKKFYSIPQDKIVRVGKTECIRCEDIPKRYDKAFSRWYGVQTGTVIDGKTAIFVYDLQRWVDWEVAGVVPMFD